MTSRELSRVFLDHDAALLRGGMRTARATGTQIAVIALLMLLPLIPGVGGVLGVSHLELVVVLAAISIAVAHSTLAFLRAGVASVWFRAAVAVDAITICGGSAYLVFASGDVLNVFWLWHAMYLMMNAAVVTFFAVHLAAAIATPLGLAAAFWLSRQDAAAAGASLLIGVSIAAIYATRHRDTRSRVVAELERLRREAEQAQREERQAIARDLHDGLGAELTAILWQARQHAAVDAETRAVLDEVAAAASVGLDELRDVVVGAQLDTVRWTDFVAALEVRGARLCRPKVEFALRSHPGDPPVLTAAARASLTRAVLEALRNAVRHGDATRVTVELWIEPEIRIVVTDDGAGIGEASEGHGLRNLRSRLRELGGQLEVSGTPGTRVELRVPRPLP